MKNFTTFLQIDLQNLFYEMKNKEEKIDFEKVWEYFNSRETEFLIGASIYMFRGNDFDSSRFESKLTSIGYTIRAKKQNRTLIGHNRLVQNEPVYNKSMKAKKQNVRIKRQNRPTTGYNKPVQNEQTYNIPIYKESYNDVEIVIDCLDKINHYSKWILMSGDGNFTDLCRYLKSKNKQIEIWSFKKCYNSSLESYADKIYFIDENFFYKKPKVKVFGLNWEPK